MTQFKAIELKQWLLFIGSEFDASEMRRFRQAQPSETVLNRSTYTVPECDFNCKLFEFNLKNVELYILQRAKKRQTLFKNAKTSVPVFAKFSSSILTILDIY